MEINDLKPPARLHIITANHTSFPTNQIWNDDGKFVEAALHNLNKNSIICDWILSSSIIFHQKVIWRALLHAYFFLPSFLSG